MALQADIRIVAENAKYGVVQVRRGVIPDCMAHWTLAKLAGATAAADILLTGRTFDGVEAVALGVANQALHHRVMGTADAREGVSAFLERRVPRWTGSVSRDWIALPDP